MDNLVLAHQRDRKGYPEEKGTERTKPHPGDRHLNHHRKGYPEEKGTERAYQLCQYKGFRCRIARAIPRKRELKAKQICMY